MTAARVEESGPAARRQRVVVVGAGITGLAAAHRIATLAPEVTLTVLEARARPGGNIETERQSGFLLDGGPDAYLRTKPEATRLVGELGLGDELVSPLARSAYVAWRGRLERLPGGMALAVPTRLGPMLSTPLLSWEGKARALGDLLLPSGWGRPAGAEEALGSFIRRRFGDEAARVIADPLLGGIYAGNAEALSAEATFPQLVRLEARHGSLVRGLFLAQRAAAGRPAAAPDGAATAPSTSHGGLGELLRWLRRADEQAQSPFMTLRPGLGALIDALVARLPSGALRLGVGATAIERGPDGYVVACGESERLPADAVVVAAPAHVAARLVPDAGLAGELAQIPYVSTATVFFGLDAAAVRHPLDGVGFIVPRGEARIMAATWVSSKWAARAPAGSVLLRAFLGGARDPTLLDEHDDAALGALALAELERLMGSLGRPRLRRVFRHVAANPQPVVGHRARVARIRARLAELPGLYVTGAAFDGVGIPDCIRQGEAAALAAVARLRGSDAPGAVPRGA